MNGRALIHFNDGNNNNNKEKYIYCNKLHVRGNNFI